MNSKVAWNPSSKSISKISWSTSSSNSRVEQTSVAPSSEKAITSSAATNNKQATEKKIANLEAIRRHMKGMVRDYGIWCQPKEICHKLKAFLRSNRQRLVGWIGHIASCRHYVDRQRQALTPLRSYRKLESMVANCWRCESPPSIRRFSNCVRLPPRYAVLIS